jgi:hypothetical protein
VIASAAALSAGVAYWLRTTVPEGRTEEPATTETSDARHSNPVLAVLPFSNMSSSAEHEYIADGTTEDVITLLAQYGVDLAGRDRLSIGGRGRSSACRATRSR